MSWLSKISKTKLSWLGLIFAAITLFSVNIIGWESLKLYRLDVTENKLFTLTDSTRKVIADVSDPITLKFYYSDALGKRAPAYGLYASRIQAMLQYYSSLSNGKIIFQKISPQAFSDEEDRAVAAGLTAIPLGTTQEKGYMALVGANSTDDEEVIPFMTLDRAAFLEYDLTSMIYKLSRPARKTVGLITGLDMNGRMGANGRPIPPWLIIAQIEEFYNVKTIPRDAKNVPDSVDILMMVSPGKMSDELVASVEQFALAGKPVLAFADPFTETRPNNTTGLKKDGANYLKLLSGWGADVVADKVVADPLNSRRIQYKSTTQPIVVNYIVWLSYLKKAGVFDRKDAVFSQIERLVMATAGTIKYNKSAGTKFSALMRTSKQTALFSTDMMVPPNPIKLINNFTSDDTFKVLAARLTGTAQAGFIKGNQSKPGQKTQGDINVIVIADSDMLFDSFWAQARNVGGRAVVVPIANNKDLVLNALENLSGGTGLSGLRGRGVENRPFTLVKAIRQKAETKFRKREQILNDKLKQAQKELADISTRASKDQAILSDEDRQSFLKIRNEVVALRRDLRGVQRSLNKDIEQLEFWVQLINTAGIPLFILFGWLVWALFRRRRVV